MRKIMMALAITAAFYSPASAATNVAATYTWIADMVTKIGGDRVSVTALAPGGWDPHHVVPRPSLIVKVRNAQLLFMSGGELEIGWLPSLIRQANNPRVTPGAAGLVDLSQFVELMDKPAGGVSRSMGDVHPEGNPHYSLDPANIPIIAAAIEKALCREDEAGCAGFTERREAFVKRWSEAEAIWAAALKPLAGARVVEYHPVFDYFIKRYGMTVVGTIEPVPGLPPTAKHLEALVDIVRKQGVRLIMQDVYHSRDAADNLAAKTGAKVVVIPHDVDAVPATGDLFALFNVIIDRLTK